MVKKTLQNLDQNTAIVDARGVPTQYFIRLLQERGILQGDDHSTLEAIAQTEIVADAPIAGGGVLGDVEPSNPQIHISHAESGVDPGVYGVPGFTPKITVDEFGHITGAEDIPAQGGVELEQAGVALAGGPFSTLNLVSGATATDAGGGQADIVFAGGGGGGGGVAGRLASVYAITSPSGGAVVSFVGHNIASVVRTGTGLFRVTFITPIPSVEATFAGSSWFEANPDHAIGVTGIDRYTGNGLTVNYVDVVTVALNGYNGAYDPVFFSFDITDPTASGGGGGGTPWYFDPPTTAEFTPWQVSGAEEVVDDTDVGMIILQPVGGVDTPVGAFKAIPPGTDWSAQMRIDTFIDGFPTASYANRSLVVTDGTKHKAAWWGPDNRQVMHYMHLFADSGSFDGYETFIGMPYMPHWWKYSYVAATGILTRYVSASGKRWIACGTDNVKAYFGADPSFIGFLVVSSVSDIGAEMVIEHYSDTM